MFDWWSEQSPWLRYGIALILLGISTGLYFGADRISMRHTPRSSIHFNHGPMRGAHVSLHEVVRPLRRKDGWFFLTPGAISPGTIVADRLGSVPVTLEGPMSGSRRLLCPVLVAVSFCYGSAHGQCVYDADTALGPDCGFPFGFTVANGSGINARGEAVGMYRRCDDSSLTMAVRWTQQTGLVPLTGFPAGTERSQAFDINDAGQIVGRYDVFGDGLSCLGFLIHGGTFTLLGTLPGGTTSEPSAINATGEIVGFAGSHVTGPLVAVRWKDGRLQTLQGLEKLSSFANDINDRGQIVGEYYLDGETQPRAFLWEENRLTDLGVITGGVSGDANAINSHGHIVGSGRIDLPEGGFISRPFLWIDGEMQVIDLPEEIQNCGAIDINDRGEILLGCGFLWRDGELTFLPDFAPPDTQWSGISQITNDGVIVGQARIAAPGKPGEVAAGLAVFTPNAPPLTDLTGDCRTDAADLRILLGQWGDAEDDSSTADFNDDGVVDPQDLALLLGNWG